MAAISRRPPNRIRCSPEEDMKTLRILTRLLCSIFAALLFVAPLYAGWFTDPPQPPRHAPPSKHKDKSAEAEARAEEEDDLYDEGTDALDDHDYKHAIEVFREVVKMKGEHQDAAMYWIGYAQNKTGNRSDALA